MKRIELMPFALTAVSQAINKYGLSAYSQAGDPTVKDITMYVTFDAEGKAGEIQLVDANTKKIEGVTNFDGNKLDPGRFIAIDSVRALCESADAVTASTADWDNVATAALKNSELVLTQGEETFSMPATDLFNLNAARSTSNNIDFREISHIPVIRPDSNYKLTWKFPVAGGQGAIAGGSALVRLEFRAHEVLFNK